MWASAVLMAYDFAGISSIVDIRGTVRDYAELLNQQEHAPLLQETLDEEKETDRRLTELSKKINAQATEKGEAREEEAEEIETRLKRATRRKPKRAA